MKYANVSETFVRRRRGKVSRIKAEKYESELLAVLTGSDFISFDVAIAFFSIPEIFVLLHMGRLESTTRVRIT